MQRSEKALQDYSIDEKTAYLKAITALATADRSATDDERYVLEAIIESADLPAAQGQAILATAAEPVTEADLQQSLDVLRQSDLKYSLVTDLVAFAESDQQYSEAEQKQVQAVASYLGVNHEQFTTINHFVSTAAAAETMGSENQQQAMMDAQGMQQQFKNAGMNFGNISKGLLGMLLPMIMGKMMSSGRNQNGGLGGLLGGLLGGGGNLSGNNNTGGGLGSLISMLSGGSGMGSIGGMLGKMFGR